MRDILNSKIKNGKEMRASGDTFETGYSTTGIILLF